MENPILDIIGKFFKLKLKFNLSGDGYYLKDVVKERTSNPLVINSTSQLLSGQNTQIVRKTLINDLLKYLQESQLGEFTYIEINFDSLKILNSKKENIFKFNILKYLRNKEIEKYIKANMLKKKCIISTLCNEPLIPIESKEIILNNLLLEAILNEFDKIISTLIISSNIIISGEMLWSNWLGDIGVVNFLKHILKLKNYNLYIDSNGIWKSILDKRKENIFLYKISSKYFLPDIFFINSIDIKEGEEFTIEGSNKQMILSKEKFINIFSSPNEGNGYPKVFIINNREKHSILDCNIRELNLLLKEKSKSLVNMKVINKISYSEFGNATADFGIKIESVVKNRQEIKEGDLIGYIQRKSLKIQTINEKNFIPESIQKQLIQKGEIIGYQMDFLGKKPIRAYYSGKIMFDFIKHGILLIEDKYPNQKLLSPWSGTCVSHSNIDGYKILLNHINIPLRYQMGNNIIAFKENTQNNVFNKLIFRKELFVEDLFIKDIIENNIKMVIIEQYDSESLYKFIKKYPYILDFTSFAFIDDKVDLRIQSILRGDFIKSIILDNGYLKIYCDSSTKEFINLRSRYSTIENNIVERISYKQNKKYGIIIKSQNSTEKVIKYDTEAVIEPNSNLINLRYKL